MNKALFLDRDGVVNVEKNYLHKIEDFELMEGIVDVCRTYAEQGYLIIIVTNQSGISRGYYTEEDFAHLSRWMVEHFKAFGITISHIYHCPHHESIDGACECRKPSPGMFLEARKEYDLDMEHSVMIGDNERDIEASLKAGVGKNILLTSETLTSKADQIIHSLRELL
ncbi:MAG: D,D-heptose 1,7-bisphosphate phosphatase [Sulfuricurvum sp. RIFOXYD2_FULL_44_160]|uniref:D,D-heptose 1,7-bisphosphate phosphatase n=1 Tax=Sulfuricurvum kujiense TaxID=148813 RepID=A0A2D3WAF9_9BACT|nr:MULTISPECIES: D-glycero-beta-D-manno-heptose 1,7-bisphosphate 7-phosphatase [Sulfuricurvum]OHD90490.1 MAG: D,D-heptose 1,7-bisphosphate phosphatase [Sulfuricurvum sp. RIFOXYD12_FULL_44_77]OHD92439.1 MAG: D,D-heptose 1,7-bisphosphate phosphatase [Sulfuricurvum sp. RIFOXYD2_FULL_44_160]DAB37398.1 MAG TPA: D-glycero-beta-D-manno-heptose-1,7-bisphosphate 7-phosphatase [Sulfuricurvum kujiense]